MSWLFSQALVAEYSEGTSLAGAQFAQLNVMQTAHKFLHNGKTMESLNHSRYGLTCAVLSPGPGMELLTSYLRGFHVKTLAQQAKVKAYKEKEADCFGKSSGFLAEYHGPLFGWKTVRCSPQEVLTKFSGPWPKWGSMRNGVVYQRLPLVQITNAKESGYLPTPSGCRSGKNHVAGRLDEWGGSSNPFRGTNLGKVRCPDFEEHLMGWPVQWTEQIPYEMDKFQQWQQQHSSCLVSDSSKTE